MFFSYIPRHVYDNDANAKIFLSQKTKQNQPTHKYKSSHYQILQQLLGLNV